MPTTQTQLGTVLLVLDPSRRAFIRDLVVAVTATGDTTLVAESVKEARSMFAEHSEHITTIVVDGVVDGESTLPLVDSRKGSEPFVWLTSASVAWSQRIAEERSGVQEIELTELLKWFRGNRSA
ncbi:MAG: hypothetical protein WD049_02085 [Candidatus Paceibacterota bacterium]